MKRRPDYYPALRTDRRELKPLRPDVPASVSRPNFRLNRSLSRFEPKPIDASIIKFSQAVIENSKAYGPAGTVLALTGIALLAVSCGSASAAVPTATSEIPHTPTLTPTPTPIHTPTFAPTFTSAPAFTPAITLTPTLSPTEMPWNWDFRLSQFEAADNDAGQNVAGVTEIVWARLLSHLDKAWSQIANYPQINDHQGYAEAMLFSQPAREADGDVVITQKRGPDFWERFGGFGFTPDNANRYPDKSAALAANPADFFKVDSDGIGRSLAVVPEQDVEFAVFAAARAAVAANYPKENFSDPAVLKRHDSEIKNLVYRAIFADSGFDPDTNEPWPGANNINDLTDSFVDENGVVCVGHRPEAFGRDRQLPEIFPKVRYDQDLELRSSDDDETLSRVDSGTGMVVTAIIDSAKKLFRIDIIDGANVRDLLRPEEARPLDNENVTVRSRLGRWVPCGQAQPGLEAGPGRTPIVSVTLQPGGEGVKIAPSKTPGPEKTPVLTTTSGPTETPGPTSTLTKTPTQVLTETPVPTSTRVTEAPTITNQPPIDTATPGPTDAGTSTPVGADTATPAVTPEATYTDIPGQTSTPFGG